MDRRQFIKAIAAAGAVVSIPESFIQAAHKASSVLYGDIHYDTPAYVAREMLKRAEPSLILEKFGQISELPKRSIQTIKFRQYKRIST